MYYQYVNNKYSTKLNLAMESWVTLHLPILTGCKELVLAMEASKAHALIFSYHNSQNSCMRDNWEALSHEQGSSENLCIPFKIDWSDQFDQTYGKLP